MAGLSDFAENLLLNYLTNATAVTRPTAWFLGLYTATPSDTGGGTEVSGGGYARQAVTFSAAAGGATANTNALTYTASGTWGTITHFGIFDALSGGNLLGYAALTASRTIASGETLTVAIGDIDVTLD